MLRTLFSRAHIISNSSYKLSLIWGLVFVSSCAALPSYADTADAHAWKLPENVAAPELDGSLDDPAWQQAPVIQDFRQVYPVEGGHPSEATEVRFIYDSHYLYVAIRCYDKDVKNITAREMQRDSFESESFPADDHVQIVLDPFDRQRDGFLFAVNPHGAMTDGRIEQSTVTVVEWDGLWDARARIDDQGWTAELKIPFSSLSFDEKKKDWGLNVQRIIRRREEMIRWRQPSQSRDGDWLQSIGHLRGLEKVDQGYGIEIRPYLSLRHLAPRNADADTDFRIGFDASWAITPALNSTLTVNTDFAEAEADLRQVNLSRFPLFFPEKRDFFLRDAPYFSFPSGSDLIMPFFSRNIGRSQLGEPVDIIAGGKFTGRAGPYTFGMLNVQQSSHSNLPDKNLLVARITRELSDELTLGTLITHGDPYTHGSNTVAGADLTWNTTEFLGDKHLKTELWMLGSKSTGLDTDIAFGGTLYYSNQPWEIYASALQIGDDFNPALGFLERNGVREYMADFTYQIPINRGGIRFFKMAVYPHFITTLDNKVESSATMLPAARLIWDNGSQFAMWLNHKQENLTEDFEIRIDNVIPEGDYTFHTVKMEYLGSTSAVLSPSGGLEVGEFYDGEEISGWLQLNYRPSPHLFIGAGYEQYDISLPSGDFTTRLITARLNLAFTPRLSWNTLAQYDNESSTFGVNSRIRWTMRPGTDVYVILNQGFVVEDSRRLRHTLSESSIKTGLTWRF